MTTEASEQRPGVLSTIRAFSVMSGGPVVLFVIVLVSAAWAVAALVNGAMPPWPALVGLGGFAVYLGIVRPWSRGWGATPAERRKSLPGDEAVPRAGVAMTRAVTIDAPPDRVWPWIAQIGQDRGGFYSYAWLENLAGCHMRNADRVHPEWQHREVGEMVLLHPAAGIKLSRFDVDRSFALDGWYFALEPESGNRTRLLARSRIPRGPVSVAYAIFVELPHFIMERKMLRTIKQRVERAERRAETPGAVNGYVRSARSAARRTLPASSRSGSSTTS
ncbi:MAG: hypothetical protein ACXVKA_06270 [Acidimicrobiia bacterium]